MKKLFLIAALLVLTVASASADTINFNGTPTSTDSWIFDGTTLTAATSGLLITTAIPGSLPPGLSNPLVLPGIFVIQTGNLTGNNAGNLTFGPTGSVLACYGSFCFTGTFTAATLDVSNAGTASFTGTFVLGSVAPEILNAIGAPQLTNVVGTLSGTLTGYNGGQNRTGKMGTLGATLEQTAVPEPASMVLLGTGLLGAGRFVRRKLVA